MPIFFTLALETDMLTFHELLHISMKKFIIWFQTRLLPVVTILFEKLRHFRHCQRIEFFSSAHVTAASNGYTDTTRAWMHNEGTFEQMYPLFADFRIDSRIRVLKQNVLLSLEERLCV